MRLASAAQAKTASRLESRYPRSTGWTQADRISDADALRYLIDFVGNVHQPLHAASNADLGGNCERILSFKRARRICTPYGTAELSRQLSPTIAGSPTTSRGYIARLGARQRGPVVPRQSGNVDVGIASDRVTRHLSKAACARRAGGFPGSCRTAPDESQAFPSGYR